MPEEKTGLEQLNRLKSGHTPLVQALFDEAYACGHKDGRADGEAVIGMLEAARSELAAAQPVMEWRPILNYDRATAGLFTLSVFVDGWKLDFRSRPTSPPSRVASGPQTGPAGKSAAEAAYRKAAGL